MEMVKWRKAEIVKCGALHIVRIYCRTNNSETANVAVAIMEKQLELKAI